MIPLGLNGGLHAALAALWARHRHILLQPRLLIHPHSPPQALPLDLPLERLVFPRAGVPFEFIDLGGPPPAIRVVEPRGPGREVEPHDEDALHEENRREDAEDHLEVLPHRRKVFIIGGEHPLGNHNLDGLGRLVLEQFPLHPPHLQSPFDPLPQGVLRAE